MIFRITTKLGKKLHITPHRSLPLASNPLADWSAQLFVADRTQYILVTNTPSLYSMVMYGKGITNDSVFLQRAISQIGEVFRDEDHEPLFQRLVVPESGVVTFSKALNPTLTGSMNELVYQAQGLLIEDGLSPFDTAFRLNDIPMGQLGMDSPRRALKKLELPASAERRSSGGSDWRN